MNKLSSNERTISDQNSCFCLQTNETQTVYRSLVSMTTKGMTESAHYLNELSLP